jgi:hypothetical protein
MKTPAEQAEAFARKRRKYYMTQYREKHREEIRAKQKAYYRRKTEEEKNGERQGRNNEDG